MKGFYRRQCVLQQVQPETEDGQLLIQQATLRATQVYEPTRRRRTPQRARKRRYYVWCFHGVGEACDPAATGWMLHWSARAYAKATNAANAWVRRWGLSARVIQGRVAGDPVVYEACAKTVEPLLSWNSEATP